MDEKFEVALNEVGEGIDEFIKNVNDTTNK